MSWLREETDKRSSKGLRIAGTRVGLGYKNFRPYPITGYELGTLAVAICSMQCLGSVTS